MAQLLPHLLARLGDGNEAAAIFHHFYVYIHVNPASRLDTIRIALSSFNWSPKKFSIMDPISAAASVVGLLGAAAKISEVLLKFIGSVKGAPKLAQNILMEVSDVSACLNQLQRYLQGAISTSSSQEQLLMVELLVVTLSNCVLIFSELEEITNSLKPEEPMHPWRLAQWLLKEQTISALLVRMQQSKSSLVDHIDMVRYSS